MFDDDDVIDRQVQSILNPVNMGARPHVQDDFAW